MLGMSAGDLFGGLPGPRFAGGAVGGFACHGQILEELFLNK